MLAALPVVFTKLPWYVALSALLPLLFGFKAFLDVRCTRFELTTQRFRVNKGVLSKRVDDLELYRVKDLELRKPLHLRLLGLGTIVMHTSDATTPTLTLYALPRVEQVRDLIRQHVEVQRDRKGVTEVDMT